MKKNKKLNGGTLDAITAISSLVPGGQFITPALSLAQSFLQQESLKIRDPKIVNNTPFGKRNGGPILPPQESTFIRQPVIRQIKPVFPTNSRDNYSEEQLLNLVANTKQQMKSYFKDNTPERLVPKSDFRFREKANGGFVGDNSKQYNTGSHQSGNDLPINQFGFPDLTGQNTVQNKENMFKIDGKPYIMSDKLTNPETGKPFNKDASKVDKKFKNARLYQDEKNTREFDLKRLSKLNDSQRQIEETRQMTNGGNPLGMYQWQFPVGDSERYQTLPDNVPLSDNIQFGSEPDKVMSNDPIHLADVNFGQPITLGTNLSTTGTVNPVKSGTTVDRGTSISSITPNKVGLALKTIALGKSIYDGLQPAQREPLVKPNYSASDKYMKEANINYNQARQDALGVSNILGNVNRSSSSFAQLQGRESARVASLQDQLSKIGETESNAQSQLNLNKAQYEVNKATDLANKQYQNQQNNFQNQAAQRMFGRNVFENLSQIGTEFNKYGETQKVIQNQKEISQFNNSQVLTYLNSKYPNLKINSDIVKRFMEGKINVDDFLTYVPSNIRSEVKTNAGQ